MPRGPSDGNGLGTIRAGYPHGSRRTDLMIESKNNTETSGTRTNGFGDTNFAGGRKVTSLINPVPGGVGPMTTAMLLRNTVESAKATVEEGG
ncbi:MAG: hypothetical protein U9Q23_00325 [Candidatus Bipolaricaulota bacterium]|nr:hypothetical protein [Candidatus Bipolaricaulota bacterium]